MVAIPRSRWLDNVRSRDTHTLKSRASLKYGTDRLHSLAFQAFRPSIRNE
jgi:hypothetical protein